MACIRFQINGNILRCRDGQGAVNELSLFQLQGLFLNVIVEGAVSKDVCVVLSGNRRIIDFDFEILYNFANLIAVLVQFGDRAKQLAGVDFSFLLTIADIDVIVIYSFQRNIAAGDLDVFAFASLSSAADGRNRAASAAGSRIYSASLNGNVFAVTLKAAANACCFATGYRRYITIANRNILTRRALTSANACTQLPPLASIVPPSITILLAFLCHAPPMPAPLSPP